MSSSASYDSGSIDGIRVNGVDITQDIRSGELKGLIELRDEVLPAQQAELDELASKLQDTINQIHNRGTSYPNMDSTMTGSRKFLDSSAQTLTLQNGDVTIGIFNADGTQNATTTLSTIMGGNGPHTIDSVASGLQTWLQANGAATASVSVNSKGQFDINLGNENLGLAFRDQVSSANGSDRRDATIGFDASGDGTIDESIPGFANFLGLNDFFTDESDAAIWDSQVKNKNFTLTTSTAHALQFSDKTNGLNYGQVIVNPGDTLQDIADKINGDPTVGKQVKASVINEGGGQRLRITNSSSEDVYISQLGGTEVIDQLGLQDSNIGLASTLSVNDALQDNNQELARGSMQYNTDTGEYFMSAGDNTVANELGNAFSSNTTFNRAGNQSKSSMSLEEYIASIIANNSSIATSIEAQANYQNSLTQNLEKKESEISDVNLDEEFSNLIVFQQSYTAAARVISTSQQMLEILTDLV
jgi:flagellar hook-associated protein 1 FlgK